MFRETQTIEPLVNAEILTTRDDVRVLINTEEMSMEGAMVMPNDKLHYNGDACKWQMLHPRIYNGNELHFSAPFVATLFGHTILRDARPKRDANEHYNFVRPTTATLTSATYRDHCNRHSLNILPSCDRLIDEVNQLSSTIEQDVLNNAIQELNERHALVDCQPITNYMVKHMRWTEQNYDCIKNECIGTDYEPRRAMVLGSTDIVQMVRKKIGPLTTETVFDVDDIDSTFTSAAQASYHVARIRQHPMCKSTIRIEHF